MGWLYLSFNILWWVGRKLEQVTPDVFLEPGLEKSGEREDKAWGLN